MSWAVMIGKGETREKGREIANKYSSNAVWGINNIERYPELTMLWEMHDWPDIMQYNNVRLDTVPVMMRKNYLDVPTCIVYPYSAMEKEYGGLLYANNTLAYMMMMAIAARLPNGQRRFTNIYLAGIDYRSADRTEIEFERACTEYWIGFAIAKGINVYWPEESNLLTYPGYERGVLYGYTKGYDKLTEQHRENYGHIAAEMLLSEHGTRKQHENHEHDKFYAYLKGCISRWLPMG